MDLLNKREFCNVVDTENNNGKKFIITISNFQVVILITSSMAYIY